MEPHSHPPNLFSLPPELRNAIYKYVLSSPDGLRYRKARGSSRALLYCPPDEVKRGCRLKLLQKHDFNQLKRVNRQLKLETNDLELHFNSIVFAQEKHRATAPDDQLVNFLLTCERPHWIACIKLVPRGELQVQNMLEQAQRAIRLCGPLPQLSIRYLVPGFACQSISNLQSFIITGMYLSFAIRGADLKFLVPKFYGDDGSETHWGRDRLIFPASWRKTGLMDMSDASKFRFWPETSSFNNDNAEDIRTYIAAKGYGDKLAELWIKYARDWVEHGI
jgi:hypothetical protein